MSVSDSTNGAITYGVTVLERVLLAIINAHTTDETQGRQAERLRAAMMALIGPTMQNGYDMDRALLYMVQQRQKDACDHEMAALQSSGHVRPRAARSVPELAMKAAREILGITATDKVQATAGILCKMFRMRGKVHAVEYDHVRDALEAEAVQRLCKELSEWDVPTRL